MFYPHGWHAYIDDVPVTHFRVNYALRALEIPAGSHQIRFRFEPEVIQKGSKWALAGSVGLLIAVLGAVWFEFFGRSKLKRKNES
jgi:uncharacterized membrane protein YfhO